MTWRTADHYIARSQVRPLRMSVPSAAAYPQDEPAAAKHYAYTPADKDLYSAYVRPPHVVKQGTKRGGWLDGLHLF